MDGWKIWEGKKVFLILKNKRTYSGIIQNVEEREHFTWITLKDKFGGLLTFNSEEISLIEEER